MDGITVLPRVGCAGLYRPVGPSSSNRLPPASVCRSPAPAPGGVQTLYKRPRLTEGEGIERAGRPKQQL